MLSHDPIIHYRGSNYKQEKSVLATVALALVLSCLFRWLPLLQQVSAGIAIVCCTVIAAALCAWLFPIQEEAKD